MSCAPGSTQDGVAACAAGASRANSGINGTRPGFGALGARRFSAALSAAAALFALALHTTHNIKSRVCSLLMLISRHRQTVAPYHFARRAQTQTHRATCPLKMFCCFANFVWQIMGLRILGVPILISSVSSNLVLIWAFWRILFRK